MRPFYCVFHSVFTAEGHVAVGPFWRPSYGRLDTACLFMQWTLVAVITVIHQHNPTHNYIKFDRNIIGTIRRLSKRLASTNKKVTEVCQKVLCGIHAAKIIQLVANKASPQHNLPSIALFAALYNAWTHAQANERSSGTILTVSACSDAVFCP